MNIFEKSHKGIKGDLRHERISKCMKDSSKMSIRLKEASKVVLKNMKALT